MQSFNRWDDLWHAFMGNCLIIYWYWACRFRFINDRFTPNRDQFKTDLRVDFLDSWAVVKLSSLDCNLVLTSISGSDWHTSKQKVYNWLSNKSDSRPHHERLFSSRPSHAIRKSIYLELTVSVSKSLHEINISRVTCDRRRTVPNHVRSNRVDHDQPARLATKGGSSCELGHSQMKMTNSTTVLDG